MCHRPHGVSRDSQPSWEERTSALESGGEHRDGVRSTSRVRNSVLAAMPAGMSIARKLLWRRRFQVCRCGNGHGRASRFAAIGPFSVFRDLVVIFACSVDAASQWPFGIGTTYTVRVP
jgi:hypothetical protein